MFEVKKVYDGIYLVLFEDHYRLCMHFLRYQECYESPKFKGQDFELVDLMEWYSKKYGDGVFSYPKDWAGFNLPGIVILESAPPDPNRYDRLMQAIGEYCLADNGGNSEFYVIGARKSKDLSTVKHEIAHGLFFVDSEYRYKMVHLVDELPPKFYEKFKETLLSRCYDERVIEDEIQAYMATGLIKPMEKSGRKHRKPFQDVFNSYFEHIKM
jgi:hypothetical protein